MNNRSVRITLYLVVALVLIVIPQSLINVLGWESAGLLAGLAATGGVFAALGHWKSLAWGSIATTIGVFLAVFASDSPWFSAVLMLGVGLAYGLGHKTGISTLNFMFPVIVAAIIGTPPTLSSEVALSATLTALVALGSMLISGLLVLLVMRTPQKNNPPELSRKVLAVFTFNVTVLFAIIGYVASEYHSQVPGMWLAITVVMIMRPYIDSSFKRGVERAAGTLLGFFLALGVATAIPESLLYVFVGLLFIERAVLIKIRPSNTYWEFVMFLTPGIILLSAPPNLVTEYSDWRLSSTVLACLACLVLLGLERLVFYRGSLNTPVTK
jgi:Fusaric acid resistance protein-like